MIGMGVFIGNHARDGGVAKLVEAALDRRDLLRRIRPPGKYPAGALQGCLPGPLQGQVVPRVAPNNLHLAAFACW